MYKYQYISIFYHTGVLQSGRVHKILPNVKMERQLHVTIYLTASPGVYLNIYPV